MLSKLIGRPSLLYLYISIHCKLISPRTPKQNMPISRDFLKCQKNNNKIKFVIWSSFFFHILLSIKHDRL